MHEALISIQKHLESVVAQIRTAIPNDEPFGNAHNNWSFPGLTRAELISEAQSIIDLIVDQGSDEIGLHEAQVRDYVRRLQHLQQHTVGQLWGNAGQAVSAYMLTLGGLRKTLAPVLVRDGHAEAIVTLRRLTNQLRGMEAKLNGLQPRTASIETMVERIEEAYNAADQLPTDLETLSEARHTIGEHVKSVSQDQVRVSEVKERADELERRLKKSAEDANAVLDRCETAYSAATSVGLAAAFAERSVQLSKSMWIWVSGLVASLGVGSYFGARQLESFTELLRVPTASNSVVLLNLLLSLLSIGAPIWFAWLATKQIGQRFRLAEDYAFKASISRAYEGFRREAARFDKDMEARLLTSALTRLDELPIRLVETVTHGSPWHELASSKVVKEAMNAVPGFADDVKDLARSAVAGMAVLRGRPESVASDN